MSHGSDRFLPKEQLLSFVYEHRGADVRQLALQRDRYTNLDFSTALNAIQARQKLARKFPDWALLADFYVPHSVMVEQASSLETARYKQRFIKNPQWTILDMSGGMGVDSFAFSERAMMVHYVDIEEERAVVAEHNFKVLGVNNILCHSGAAELQGVELAAELQPDMIFIDPDRRPEHKGRVFLLEEAMPDITELLPRLMEVVEGAEFLVKLSPLVDIDYLKQRLPYRFDVHMVGVKREAKELLLHIHRGATYQLNAIELLKDSSLLLKGRDHQTEIEINEEVGCYMYDLYPTVGKFGLEYFPQEKELWKPHRHTHIFFSNELIEDFPGRRFKVLEHNSGDRRWLKQLAKEPMHLVAKNIPVHTDRLRQKLGIREGGERFLFVYGGLDSRTHYILATLVDE